MKLWEDRIMFVGRKYELTLLREVLSRESFQGIVVYGRRRLGKTELVKEAAKSFSGKVLYYQCLNSKSESDNVKGLLAVARLFFPDLLLSDQSSLFEVLKAFFVLAKKEPLCLILDEYPFLRQGELTDSQIQSLIDAYKDDSALKLILCGSYIGIREEILDASKPLYGRFQTKIKLAPFDYNDAAKMFPTLSADEKIRYYAVFGGTPYFLSQIDPAKGLEGNIKDLLLREFAPLEREILDGVGKEYCKITNASIIMDCLASGLEKYGDLKTLFRDKCSGDFDYTLSTLLDMGLVRKNGTLNHSAKFAYYGFGDNLYNFYFTCVHPYLPFRDVFSVDEFFSRYIESPLETSFLPHTFESIAQEFLIRRNRLGLNEPLFSEIGRVVYNDPRHHRNGEFDLVSRDEKGDTYYECKYTNDPLTLAVALLEEKQLKDCGLPHYRMGFIARKGFAPELQKKGYLLFSLPDFFAFKEE
jgi:AAA+ ATPase superfamily predicted ATPase